MGLVRTAGLLPFVHIHPCFHIEAAVVHPFATLLISYVLEGLECPSDLTLQSYRILKQVLMVGLQPSEDLAIDLLPSADLPSIGHPFNIRPFAVHPSVIYHLQIQNPFISLLSTTVQTYWFPHHYC